MALSVVGTLRGRLLAGDAVSSKGKRASARNTMPHAKRSSAATFRNIPAHNAIVIIQTTHTAFHKQRKRDNANNASVVLLCSLSRNNGTVISRFRSQVFVTFRNISLAYLSHKAGLLVQAYYYAPMPAETYNDSDI